MACKISKYFLGETTPYGFRTDFGKTISAEGYYTYILKGGPGTGKSGLMKRIALKFSDTDDIELYYCSSDPDSLDAVVLKNHRAIVVDGTAPHMFDAAYPGISQTILNLGECWDCEVLRDSAREIRLAADENALWHARCNRYVTALAAINSDIYSIGKDAVNLEKLEGFLERTAKKLLPKKFGDTQEFSFKKLSALTLGGYRSQPLDNFTQVYVLGDPFFAVSDLLLQRIAERAASLGLEVTVSVCSLFKESVFEQVLLPKLGIAFCTSNFSNHYTDNDAAKINCLRFYNLKGISAKKQRLAFSKKASTELQSEAVACLNKAKDVHDILENYYIKAMDFGAVTAISDRITREISSRATHPQG